jgi:hypothetical protein
MSILLYLEARQIVNYARITLRSPKRLVPAILVVLWMLMFIGPQLMLRLMGPRRPISVLSFTMPPQIPIALFALLSIVMFYKVHKSFSEGIVTFPLADIDFLFPTPISKRTILALRLLGMYAKVGLYVVFFTFIFGYQLSMVAPTSVGISISGIALILFAVFVVNICTTINLVATFREAKKWWLSYAVRWLAYGLLIFVAGRWLLGYVLTGSFIQGAIQTFKHPLVVTLLLPAKWATDLMLSPFAGSSPGLRGELLGMWALALGSLALVLSRSENPYEPSLGISARAAAIRSAIRRGGFGRARAEMQKFRPQKTKAGIAIPPFGRGAIALLWKSLNVTMRTSGTALMAVPFIVAVLLGGLRLAAPQEVGVKEVQTIATVLIGYLLFISSTMMLHSFRGDLKQANILRPMPIPAWQVIAMQGVHSTLISTATAWVVVILISIFYGLNVQSPLTIAVLALPFAAYASLCWQAVAAVIYPNPEDPTQQFVGNMLSGFAVFVTIGPVVGIGALGWLFHLGVVLPAMMIAAFSTVMAVGGILLSSWLYKRFDPTDE